MVFITFCVVEWRVVTSVEAVVVVGAPVDEVETVDTVEAVDTLEIVAAVALVAARSATTVPSNPKEAGGREGSNCAGKELRTPEVHSSALPKQIRPQRSLETTCH
jgi:hypothetical protein